MSAHRDDTSAFLPPGLYLATAVLGSWAVLIGLGLMAYGAAALLVPA